MIWACYGTRVPWHELLWRPKYSQVKCENIWLTAEAFWGNLTHSSFQNCFSSLRFANICFCTTLLGSSHSFSTRLRSGYRRLSHSVIEIAAVFEIKLQLLWSGHFLFVFISLLKEVLQAVGSWGSLRLSHTALQMFFFVYKRWNCGMRFVFQYTWG